MRHLYALSLSIILTSCVMVKPTAIDTIGPDINKPIATNYANININDTTFFKYVDDYNWFILEQFNYLLILNTRAKHRDWTSPIYPPLCGYVKLPELDPLPAFYPREATSKDIYIEQLERYTHDLRLKYRLAIDAIDDARTLQLERCLY